jgi:hypothetical protein
MCNRNAKSLFSGVGILGPFACGLSLLLAGCSSSSMSNSPKIPMGSVSFAIPATNATLSALPITVGLNLLDGASLTSLKLTLNGVDITQNLSASGTTVQAQVTHGVYIGANRLEATIGGQTVTSQFNYAPGATSGPPTATAPTAPTLPIYTRVQMTNPAGQSGFGIQVGQSAYFGGSGNGYQILLLSRIDLSMISNTIYSVSSYSDFQAFMTAFAPSAAKTCAGSCLQIVQSLTRTGYAPCYDNSNQSVCAGAFPQLAAAGSSAMPAFLNPTNPNVGYSFIGNVGTANLHAGTSYERATCSETSPTVGLCDQYPQLTTAQIAGGVVPNSTDGDDPSIFATTASGTSTVSATTLNPALPISNVGAIAGNLILDNYGLYTFTWNTPAVGFSMQTETDSTGTRNLFTIGPYVGNTTGFSLESAYLPTIPNVPKSQQGGFHLVVLDATTFQDLANSTYTVQYCGSGCTSNDPFPVYPLSQLITDLQNANSRRNLVFLASIGNIQHTGFYEDNPPNGNCADLGTPPYTAPCGQDIFDAIAQKIQNLGGTFITFAELSNPGIANDPYEPGNFYGSSLANPVPQDSYSMVGQFWIPASGLPNPHAHELSSVITRATVKAYNTPSSTPPSDMYGLLKVDHQGYYEALLHSRQDLLPQSAVTLVNAAYTPPIPWPLPGSDSGLQAAYQWMSEQVLGCLNGCGDIRSFYSDLNQSGALWLAALNTVAYPADGSVTTLGFSSDELETMRTQLNVEFTYLQLIRDYQNNLLSLLQSEQTNLGLLLTQDVNNIIGNIQFVNTSTSTNASCDTCIFQDSLTIAADAAGFVPILGSALKLGFGVGNMVTSLTAEHTHDPNGRPLIEQQQDLVTAGTLAGSAAKQYQEILTSIGGNFDRTVSDWGRLQSVGQLLQTGAIIWDGSFEGALLQAHELAAQRSFYPQLMANGYVSIHYLYGAPGINSVPAANGFACNVAAQIQNNGDSTSNLQTINPDVYGFWPGAPIGGPGTTYLTSKYNYPRELWWDFWQLSTLPAYQTAVSQNVIFPACEQYPVLPQASFFSTTQLFHPIDPSNPGALGLYKPWFFQRNLPIGDFNQVPSVANHYGNNFQPPYIFPSNADPDSY